MKSCPMRQQESSETRIPQLACPDTEDNAVIVLQDISEGAITHEYGFSLYKAARLTPLALTVCHYIDQPPKPPPI